MDLISLALPMISLIAVAQPDYQFTQEIEPIVCTTTTIAINRMHVTGQSTCDESYVPTLTDIISDDTRLILKGKFDAGQARTFRVHIFGIWYVLGDSPYLTANGNEWTLDLSHLKNTIKSGMYTITIEMLTHNSFFYQDTFQSDITIMLPEPALPPDGSFSPDEVGEDVGNVGTPGDELADTGQNVAFFVILGFALIAASGAVLWKVRQKNT